MKGQESSPADPLDHWLAHLPGEQPPDDLAFRICLAVRARRRRILALHAATSAGLASLGGWLALPALAAWSVRFEMPSSGIPMLLAWLELALAGFGSLVDQASHSLVSHQGAFNASLSFPAWSGLIALGLSALLALSYLLPRPDV